MKLSENNIIRSICKESFYEFVKEFWGIIIKQPCNDNWHIKYLCDEIQIVCERVIKNQKKEYDLVINIPPGSTKSTIASVMLAPWLWTRMPECQLINSSYTQTLSQDLSTKARDIVESEKYAEIFPEVNIRDDSNTKNYFKNTKNGYRFATSVGGSVTGFHGHILVCDDPLNPQSAISTVDVETANNWLGQTFLTRKIDNNNTVFIMIMQRLHQNDPSGNFLKKATEESKKIKHICIPGELTKDVKPFSLRKFYKDGLFDPIRMSRESLLDKKIDLGNYGYSGQILQNPIPLGGGMFKTSELVMMKESSKDADFKRIIRYWDKAASTKKQACYTAGVKMGLDSKGRYWILNVKRGQWQPEERDRIIKQTAIADGVKVHQYQEQEPGSSGISDYQALVRLLAGYTVKAHRPTGDKVLRADPFATMVGIGNVYVVEGDWNNDYFDELKFFPNSTNKDQVDASSGAYTVLTKPKKKLGVFGK